MVEVIIDYDRCVRCLECVDVCPTDAIVAEDGNSQEMQNCIKMACEKYNFEIKHTTQEDEGIRKARSQNNGILAFLSRA